MPGPQARHETRWKRGQLPSRCSPQTLSGSTAASPLTSLGCRWRLFLCRGPLDAVAAIFENDLPQEQALVSVFQKLFLSPLPKIPSSPWLQLILAAEAEEPCVIYSEQFREPPTMCQALCQGLETQEE